MSIKEALKIVQFLKDKGFVFGLLEDTIVVYMLQHGQCTPRAVIDNKSLPSFSEKLNDYNLTNKYTFNGNVGIIYTDIIDYNDFMWRFTKNNILKKMYGFGKYF